METLTKIRIDGQKLKAARGSRKQTNVADILGISKQILCDYEKGRKNPSAVTLAHLCQLYEVQVQDLTTAE